MTYADQSNDGAGNGSGGQFMHSTQQVLDANQRRLAVETKAATDPASLTEADLSDLPADTLSDLMGRGALSHLGIGARRRPKARR